MPRGRTHDRATILFSPIVIGGILLLELETYHTITFISLYFFSSFMFNGDLDVISRPYNRWGLLKFIWIPYQRIFSHRSVWTHGIIIGTIVRLSYLTIFLSPIILLYFDDIRVLIPINLEIFSLIFLGLESGSILHTTLDYTIK